MLNICRKVIFVTQFQICRELPRGSERPLYIFYQVHLLVLFNSPFVDHSSVCVYVDTLSILDVFVRIHSYFI